MENKELIEKINKLKKEKNAVILVHNYQRPEIYEIADFLGDSLDLSIAASKTKAKIIVFCGVDFMAESAKILSPGKKVLLPSKTAECPMAAMATAEKLRKLKKQHPKAAAVCYINTSAEVKAECDICCTSRNVIEIINSLPNDEIIFVPDQHMGRYAQQNTNKKIILWDGYCYVHADVILENIKKAKKLHPNAKIMAHPECPIDILNLTDHITGTQGMIKYAKQSPAKEFIVITEQGMSNRLKREMPNKKFYPAAGICFNMKRITLENTYEALKKEQYEITIDEEIRKKAKKALDRMLEFSK